MKILVGQPKLEQHLCQLEKEVMNNLYVDIFIYPEGYVNDNLDAARFLAQKYQKIILTGYKRPKDRAVIIDRNGTILLDRAKYDKPKVINIEDLVVGFLLCDELVLQGLEVGIPRLDFVVHPIGVGMFSEDQFEEWITKAKEIARDHKTIIIGTSHADGSFRNCGVSIPIAYCIDPNGEEIFVMKNDIRSVVLDLKTLQYEIIDKKSIPVAQEGPNF
jgi:hypothetical protein